MPSSLLLHSGISKVSIRCAVGMDFFAVARAKETGWQCEGEIIVGSSTECWVL